VPNSITLDTREIEVGLRVYRGKIHEACVAVATYFQPILESEAKQNAPWVDRSGLARIGLHSFVDDVSQTMVYLYLAHKMDYGVFLETKHSGRYAIILPTIEAHYRPIFDMLQDVLK
jgi:hypothetical protein